MDHRRAKQRSMAVTTASMIADTVAVSASRTSAAVVGIPVVRLRLATSSGNA